MSKPLSPAVVRMGGLAVGILLPLLLAGVLGAGKRGGFSDTRPVPEPVFIVE